MVSPKEEGLLHCLLKVISLFLTHSQNHRFLDFKCSYSYVTTPTGQSVEDLGPGLDPDGKDRMFHSKKSDQLADKF